MVQDIQVTEVAVPVFSIAHVNLFVKQKRPPEPGERIHANRYNAVGAWTAFPAKVIGSRQYGRTKATCLEQREQTFDE